MYAVIVVKHAVTGPLCIPLHSAHAVHLYINQSDCRMCNVNYSTLNLRQCLQFFLLPAYYSYHYRVIITVKHDHKNKVYWPMSTLALYPWYMLPILFLLSGSCRENILRTFLCLCRNSYGELVHGWFPGTILHNVTPYWTLQSLIAVIKLQLFCTISYSETCQVEPPLATKKWSL